MTAARIAVVIPTITGREDHYERCVRAYQNTTAGEVDIQLITVLDQPTCADGWNIGAGLARAPYLHFAADDLEPHPGWWVPAIEAVDEGLMPAPRIVNADGTLDYCGEHGVELPDWRMVQMSVIPFFTAEQWNRIGPCLPIHYFSDNYLSWRAAKAGHPTVVRRGYAFTHHWAQVGRGAGMSVDERMRHDGQVFSDATGMVVRQL